MAIKLEFDFDFKEVVTIIRNSKRASDANVARDIGRATTRRMKQLISRGISPIRGSGRQRRFESYRNTYRERIRKGKFAGKGLRPVNLRLSGQFLNSLTYRVLLKSGSYVTRLGFFDEESIQKELGHRLGTNNQAKRPIIPTIQEEFAAVIVDEQEQIYEEAVEMYLKDKLK